MHRAIVLTVTCFLILLSGCAIKPVKNDMSAFYAHKPRSILIVPVLNETTEISASSVFISTITKPLAERGYYVFPVYLTSLILRDFGLSEAGHIHELSPHRLYELFGADAVLFVVIKDWSSKYLLMQSKVVVEMDYELRDTKTGTVLWQSNQRVQQGSGGGGGAGVVGLVSMAVMAAVNAMLTPYRPLASRANMQAFVPPKGLPAGPYHIDHDMDQDKF